MKKNHRLRKNADFQKVRSEGRTWSNPFLVLSARPNGLVHSRFGFVVSRRIGTAVRRNRVKRVLREAARLRLSSIAAGWDLVFIARGAAAEADFRTLDGALAQLLRAGGVLNGNETAPSPSGQPKPKEHP